MLGRFLNDASQMFINAFIYQEGKLNQNKSYNHTNSVWECSLDSTTISVYIW